MDGPPASLRPVDDLDFNPRSTINTMVMVKLLLVHSVPGKLAQFTLLDAYHKEHQGFILARNTRQLFNPPVCWEVDLPHGELEELLLGVTNIRLNRFYPHWTSRAYHGLVKLHLTDATGTFISIAALAGILKASPQLRFFHFGAGIGEGATPEPVRMDELEVLHLEFKHRPHRGILDLILPGSKPLRMSIVTNLSKAPELTQGEFRRFFERSNITGLHVDYCGNGIQFDIFILLKLVPNVRILSLGGAEIFVDYEPPSDSEGITAAPQSHLQLYISSCYIFPEVFRAVARGLSRSIFKKIKAIILARII